MGEPRIACALRIGDKAPEFAADTTFGEINISDYRDKWVVFFSHPADFSPVCTTELMAFTSYFPYFEQRNSQLLGLSIDSISAHLAWVYNIYRNTGVQIPFPVIADMDMSIAQMYGMISREAVKPYTVRSVFIIDREGIIRAILQYPLAIGRYIPEILRLLDALQTSDEQKVATPANWVPGSPVLVQTPHTYRELEERVANPEGFSCVDWYLCFKPDESKISQKV